MKTYKGKPINLIGNVIEVGADAPNFKLVNQNLEDVHLSDFKNDYIVISSLPSLDTPVCDLQTKTLYEEIYNFPNLDIEVITISMDLPYAQIRWQNNEELEGSIILSDYNYRDFGNSYGMLIEQYNLLARAIFILDKKRKVIFKLAVDDMSQHLNYDELLNFIKQLPGN